MTEKKILRAADICSEYGFSASWLYKAIASGKFPKGTRYGARLVGWERSVVEEWFASKREAPVVTNTETSPRTPWTK